MGIELLTRQPHGADQDPARPPQGYMEVARIDVSVDGAPAELIRYAREDRRNRGLGGEHFSLLRGAEGGVKGLVRFDAALAQGRPPSREAAREIAIAFLERAAPELLATLELHWIERHDEPLTTEDADLMTGMKVKMRNAEDGRWFWVIVGSDGAVMAFERDIVWVDTPGRRQTEKWLHDVWIMETGRAGIFLGAPTT